MTPARPFGQGFGTMSSPAMGTGFAPAPMGTGTPFGGAPMTTGTPFGQPGGMGGMPAPMQNSFLGGQPQGTSLPPPIPPVPQGPGAGPTSQPQTMQDRLARASELLRTQGGGMGQPYITDRGYFGPGTMSNPTGPQFGQERVVTEVNRPPVNVPQFGQERVVTEVNRPPVNVPQYGGGMGQPMPLQVDRPLTGVPQYGGGMGQPRSAEDAWRLHSAMALYAPGTDMAKEKQDFIANYNARQGVLQGGTPFTLPPQVSRNPDTFHPGVPVSQGPGAGVTPEMLSKLLQGTPSGANGPYPAQVRALPFQPQQISLQQQRMMDRLNQQFGRQMQPYQQQMDQLQQKYMSQPPQELLRFDQEFQKMPEYQAMQKAAQSGNIQEANRLRNAFESSPQFQQFQLTRNAYEQQQQQAQQKMMADPRFNQLQNRMQELQRRQQRLIQARQPQPQVLPAQPRPQVLPSEGLAGGIAGLLGGMMF